MSQPITTKDCHCTSFIFTNGVLNLKAKTGNKTDFTDSPTITFLACFLNLKWVFRSTQPEGCTNAWRVMSPSRMFFLFAVLCVALFHLVSGQNCSEDCKACGGPEKNQCLQCHTGFILHDNLCVDIDECGTDLDRCPDNTYCLNTHGSYDCKGCDEACIGCMGGGAARCKKCAPGFRSSGMRCIDIDECAEEVLACPGVNVFCVNTEGSFHCQCAGGYTRTGNTCERSQTTGQMDSASAEKGFFDDIKEDEFEVLQQMFFGVVLCALATLAAKGDLVFTSIFLGAVAAMAGYWLSDKSDRVIDSILRGR